MVNLKNSKQTKIRGNKPQKTSITNSRIEKYYNKIVAAFVVLTCVLVVLIVYFSFSKTSIIITPAETEQEITFSKNIKDLNGVVFLTESEGSKTYTDLTSTETKSAKATGTVTIYNHYSKNQPLVKTTRLLSEDGILFRTLETVNVPAGGEIDVDVIADQEGAEGNIDASKFEIVALWEGLKEDIFAESTTAMTGGEVEVGVVTQTDIANAKQALSDELIQNAQDLFSEELEKREELPEDPYLSINACGTESISSEVDTEAGNEVDSFTVTEKVTIACPVIDKTILTEFIEQAGQEQIAVGYKPASSVQFDSINVELVSLNEDKADGELEISLTINTALTEDNELITAKELTNKTEQEITTYLTAFDEIESVEVNFSPFWVKKTPSLADHININIK